jgi:acetyl esterase
MIDDVAASSERKDPNRNGGRADVMGGLDPELARVLERFGEVGTEARLDDLELIRSLRDTLAIHEALGASLPVHRRVHTRNLEVPGRQPGRQLLVRLYRPDEHDGAALLFLHGGAFVLGDVYVEEERCLRWAADAGVLVASVGYALAPEEPFPAGLEDAYAALGWLVAESNGLGVDPGRVAVGGSSAGAGLAAALTLAVRRRGGPALGGQILVYPMLDDRLDTPSMQLRGTPLFSRQAAADAWAHYLGGPGGAGPDSPTPGGGGVTGDGPAARLGPSAHLAAAGRATDLGGLPPAYVMVAEFDPLRDEGITYARRLVEAGVSCELHLFPGTFHGFEIPGSRTGVGERALREQAGALARMLGRRGA